MASQMARRNARAADVHVAFYCDAVMLPHALTAIKSVIASSSDPTRLVIHIFSHDRLVHCDKRLAKLIETVPSILHTHIVDEVLLDGLRQVGHISVAGFGRLLLPDLLPGVERVIYLDADIIANRDVCELAVIDLCGMPLAAVPDFLIPSLSSSESMAYALAEARDPNSPALNSGVLLMDLQAWRTGELSKEIIGFCRRHSQRLWLADQDALNIVLSGRWLSLELEWNVQLHAIFGPGGLKTIPRHLSHLAADRRCKGNCIYHFTGHLKPWNSGPCHPLLGIWSNLRSSAEGPRLGSPLITSLYRLVGHYSWAIKRTIVRRARKAAVKA